MPVAPYPRPALEIEYDAQALSGAVQCCRFVPVVVRVCGLPPEERHARLEVYLQRFQITPDNEHADAYEWRQRHARPAQKTYPNYAEYQFALLARPHSEETGILQVEMFSAATSRLSYAKFIFDSREAAPIIETCEGFSPKQPRLISRIRSQEERDLLRGRIQAFEATEKLVAIESETLESPTLF
jgi:hypothetical protein